MNFEAVRARQGVVRAQRPSTSQKSLTQQVSGLPEQIYSVHSPTWPPTRSLCSFPPESNRRKESCPGGQGISVRDKAQKCLAPGLACSTQSKKKKIGINRTQDPIMYRIKYQADLFLCKDEKTVKSLASHPPSGPTALLTSHHHDDLNGVSPIPRDSSALPPH